MKSRGDAALVRARGMYRDLMLRWRGRGIGRLGRNRVKSCVDGRGVLGGTETYGLGKAGPICIASAL
jgi:hypothetical protein